MKALSIQQPWAWLIVNGHKDVENRSWHTSFRGEVLIHASKKFDKAGYQCVQIHHPHIEMPHFMSFDQGGIVGKANIVDCVSRSSSPWFYGDWGFVIEDAKPLPFIPALGKLGIFEIDIPHLCNVDDFVGEPRP